MSSKKEQTFKEKIKQLEDIVAWFDSEDVDLDEAVEKYEQGAKLAKELKADISGIENKVRKIQAQ